MDKLYGKKVKVTRNFCLVCSKKLNPKEHTHKCLDSLFSREAIALV